MQRSALSSACSLILLCTISVGALTTPPPSLESHAQTENKEKEDTDKDQPVISSITDKFEEDENTQVTQADKQTRNSEQSDSSTPEISPTNIKTDTSGQDMDESVRRSGAPDANDKDFWSDREVSNFDVMSEAQAEADALSEIMNDNPIRINSKSSMPNYGDGIFPYNIIEENNNMYYPRSSTQFSPYLPMYGKKNMDDTVIAALNGKILTDARYDTFAGEQLVGSINPTQGQYILSPGQVNAVISALNTSNIILNQYYDANDSKGAPRYYSSIIPNNDLIFLKDTPGAENLIFCLKEGEFHNLITPTKQCLVCSCAVREARLEPVCASCNNCPALQEAKRQTSASACDPLPVGVTFEHPLNPCHVCVCYVAEGNSTRISCQKGTQCVKQADIPSLTLMPQTNNPVHTPLCSKFPIEVEFPHPTDHCQKCICLDSDASTGPGQPTMQCMPTSLCSPNQPTDFSPESIYLPPGTPSATFPESSPLGDFPLTDVPISSPSLNEPYGPMMPSNHLSPQVILETPRKVIGSRLPYMSGLPVSPVQYTLPTTKPLISDPTPINELPLIPADNVPSFEPISVKYVTGPPESSDSMPPFYRPNVLSIEEKEPPQVSSSVTPDYPGQPGNTPGNQNSWNSFPVTESTNPLPWPPTTSENLGSLPYQSPLLGRPPHESCLPYPKDELFQHPWVECQVCRCSEFHSQGHVSVEVNCYTKPSCCIVPYAPQPTPSLEATTHVKPQIGQLKILDKMCELKPLGAEFRNAGDECRVCSCQALGQIVVPLCSYKPLDQQRCAAQPAPQVKVIYIERRCRVRAPGVPFDVACNTCVCRAVLNYVIATCTPRPGCEQALVGGELAASASVAGDVKTQTLSSADVRAIGEFLAHHSPLQGSAFDYRYPYGVPVQGVRTQNPYVVSSMQNSVNSIQPYSVSPYYSQRYSSGRPSAFDSRVVRNRALEGSFTNTSPDIFYKNTVSTYSPIAKSQIGTYKMASKNLSSKYLIRSGNEDERSGAADVDADTDRNAYLYSPTEPQQARLEYTTAYSQGRPDAAVLAERLLASGGVRAGRGSCQFAGDRYHLRCQSCHCFSNTTGGLYSVCTGTPCTS